MIGANASGKSSLCRALDCWVTSERNVSHVAATFPQPSVEFILRKH